MHKRILRSISAAIGVLVIAALAMAQNADKNTAGPTANQLQLRLTEPREGATITGTQVRVTVAYNATQSSDRGRARGSASPTSPTPSLTSSSTTI